MHYFEILGGSIGWSVHASEEYAFARVFYITPYAFMTINVLQAGKFNVVFYCYRDSSTSCASVFADKFVRRRDYVRVAHFSVQPRFADDQNMWLIRQYYAFKKTEFVKYTSSVEGYDSENFMACLSFFASGFLFLRCRGV